MEKDRQTVHDRVLDEYDVIYGFRPEKPAEIALEDGDETFERLFMNLRGALGIDEGGELPEGTLEDLIDYLHERWDGVTVEAIEPD